VVDAPALCAQQLEQRGKKMDDLVVELALSCARREHLRSALATSDDDVRSLLRAEEAESAQLYSRLIEIVGPQKSWMSPALRIALTVLVGLAGIGLAGAHARSLRIPRLGSLRSARRPFWLSAGLPLVVGSVVTCWESFDAGKDGFDWSSYCLAGAIGWGEVTTAGAAFWMTHATILTVSGVVGMQTVAGWHVTRMRFAPVPNPRKYDWGIRGYMTFLEVWCFLIVLLAAGITALWVHGMVTSHTNFQTFFMGFGALLPACWLVLRMMRNAHMLRVRCERLRFWAPDPDELPPDPSTGLLSDGWWRVPALFASATAIAEGLLRWGGVGRLLGF